MTLDVKSVSSSPPQPEIACPMCPHNETSAAKMEEHVNRKAFVKDQSFVRSDNFELLKITKK